MTFGPFTATTLRMFSGVLIWAAHFTVVYGYTAIACARGFAHAQWLGVESVTWAVAAATAVAVVAALAMLLPAARAAHKSFESWMTAAVCALALFAIVLETLPVWLVPACS